jgi:phospholipase A1
MKIFLLLILSLSIQVSARDARFSKAKDAYENLLDKSSILLPHKGTYLMPFSYNANATDQNYSDDIKNDSRGEYEKKLEAEFQVSFLVSAGRNLFNTDFDLLLGYTQHSWWQVFNENWSRPFRESNYEPELFFRKIMNKDRSIWGIDLIGYDVGIVHQSNGETQEMSRSWNRLLSRFVLSYDNIIIRPTIWWRIPEEKETKQNADIYRYLGYGELAMNYYFDNKDTIGILWRPGTDYHGVELNYTIDIGKNIRPYIKGYYGYGESLINYNIKSERIAIGFSIPDIVSDAMD